MDQDVSKDELQQVKDLLLEQLKLQELVLRRLERLEELLEEKRTRA